MSKLLSLILLWGSIGGASDSVSVQILTPTGRIVPTSLSHITYVGVGKEAIGLMCQYRGSNSPNHWYVTSWLWDYKTNRYNESIYRHVRPNGIPFDEEACKSYVRAADALVLSSKTEVTTLDIASESISVNGIVVK